MFPCSSVTSSSTQSLGEYQRTKSPSVQPGLAAYGMEKYRFTSHTGMIHLNIKQHATDSYNANSDSKTYFHIINHYQKCGKLEICSVNGQSLYV